MPRTGAAAVVLALVLTACSTSEPSSAPAPPDADRTGARPLVTYPGEDHAFYARWEDSIRLTVRFLRRPLEM